MPAREIFFRDEHMKRIRSTFKDPNVFGPYLVPSILACISIFLAGTKHRITTLGILCLLVTGLILTFSRGAWAHFVVSLAVLMPALLFYRRTAHAAVIGLSTGIALAVLIAAYFSGEIISALEESFLFQRLSLQSYDTGRFALISVALSDMFQNPLGIGPYQSWVKYGEEPHNTFILLGLHNGIPALVGFLLIILIAVYNCIRKISEQRDGWFKYVFVLATLIGLLFLSNVVSSLHWRHLYVVLGLAFGEYRSNLVFQNNFRRRIFYN
jgi:O-antigen ligase